MNSPEQLRLGYDALLQTIRVVSEECAEDLERIQRDGLENPMTDVEFRQFLTRCLDVACAGADRRGDETTSNYLRAHKARIVQRVTTDRKEKLLKNIGDSPTRIPIEFLEHEG